MLWGWGRTPVRGGFLRHLICYGSDHLELINRQSTLAYHDLLAKNEIDVAYLFKTICTRDHENDVRAFFVCQQLRHVHRQLSIRLDHHWLHFN